MDEYKPRACEFNDEQRERYRQEMRIKFRDGEWKVPQVSWKTASCTICTSTIILSTERM